MLTGENNMQKNISLCKKEEELRNIYLLNFTKGNLGRIKQKVLMLVEVVQGGGNTGVGDISLSKPSA